MENEELVNLKKYMNMYKIKAFRLLSAFTLAEVLITLGIIGVVAAITIPILMNNIQDLQFKSALKKQYSSVSQAFSMILKDNGGSFKDLCTGQDSSCMQSLFSNYLAINKSCSNSTDDGCWHQANQWSYINPDTVIGKYAGILGNSGGKADAYPGAILNDGSFVSYSTVDGSCNTLFLGNANTCGYLMFDVNGFKKPNTVGKDIFGFWVNQNKIIPVGNNDDFQGYCSTSGSGGAEKTGWGCTAQYLIQ